MFAEKFDIRIIHASDDSCYKNQDLLPTFSPDESRAYFANFNNYIFKEAQRLCQENDVVIGNMGAYYLQAYAELENKTYVTLSLEHSLIPKTDKAFKGAGFYNPEEPIEESWRKLEEGINDFYGDFVNSFRRNVGLKPIENLFRQVTHSPVTHLIGVSKVFCQPDPSWNNHRYVCGCLYGKEVTLETQLTPGFLKFVLDEAPMFFSIGSANYFQDPIKFFNIAIESASNLSRKLILQGNWGTIDTSLLLLNDKVYLLENNVDHKLIFPYCSVIVHHGGSGTTHAAVYSGCPSVIIEFGGDMVFWAYELFELGVAPKSINGNELSTAQLTSRLSEVFSSPSMKEKATELSEIMKTENPIDIVLQALNKNLSEN